VFTKARIAVFIDGCFWHGCPEHGRRVFRHNVKYWPAKIAANVAGAALTVACAVAAAPIATASRDPQNDTISCPAGELDNCYKFEQMREFVEIGEQMVISYLNQIGVSGRSLPTLAYIPSAISVSSPCVDQNGNGTQHDRSYDYCPTDNTVYIGQNSLWDFYQQYGAASPISGLAHEYGHYLQAFTHVPDPTTPIVEIVTVSAPRKPACAYRERRRCLRSDPRWRRATRNSCAPAPTASTRPSHSHPLGGSR